MKFLDIYVLGRKSQRLESMSWYKFITCDSSYLKMVYGTGITKFPCQFHYNELSSDL